MPNSDPHGKFFFYLHVMHLIVSSFQMLDIKRLIMYDLFVPQTIIKGSHKLEKSLKIKHFLTPQKIKFALENPLNHSETF